MLNKLQILFSFSSYKAIESMIYKFFILSLYLWLRILFNYYDKHSFDTLDILYK